MDTKIFVVKQILFEIHRIQHFRGDRQCMKDMGGGVREIALQALIVKIGK